MEFDGFVAAGTFAEVSEIPAGCNAVDAKWLYNWNRDSHGMVDMAGPHGSYGVQPGRGGRLV